MILDRHNEILDRSRVCALIKNIGTYNDCVLSLSPNYLSDTYTAKEYAEFQEVNGVVSK